MANQMKIYQNCKYQANFYVKMIIVPETTKYENVRNSKRFSFCYLHGKLEEDAGYDIFGVINPLLKTEKHTNYVISEMEDGAYPCTFEGKDCTFFFWNDKNNPERHRGLVVYNDDEEGFNYALKSFNERAKCL